MNPSPFFMNWDRAKRKEKYILIPMYMVAFLASRLTGIRCIWKHFLGITCPGCGFTRSVISMLRLDFRQAWEYHPMYWSCFLIGLFFVFEGEVFPNRKWNRIVGTTIIIGFVAVWIYRLSMGITV